MSEDNIGFQLALTANQIEIDEAIEFMQLHEVAIQVVSSTPLHMGMEEVTFVLSILGGISSIVKIFEFLAKHKGRFEIQIKTEEEETIFLAKDNPWTLNDLRKILKIEE